MVPPPGDANRLPPNVIPFPVSAIHRVHPPTPRRRLPPPPVRVVLVALLGALLGVAVSWLAATWYEMHRVSHRIGRIPGAFSQPEAERPSRPASAAGSVNVLIAGLDGERKTGLVLGSRTDAIIVLHLDADRTRVWLTSIPRDSWVTLPGFGENKLNAAYPIGGPSLLVRTVEQLTGIRMDHLVVIDWTGFRRLTDGVGGVAVSLGARTRSLPDSTPARVAYHMSGPVALDYVRDGATPAAGDLDRIHRQQHYLRALIGQVLERRLLTDPSALRALAAGIGDAVRVDSGLTASQMLSLAASVQRLTVDDVGFLTAPVTGVAQEGEASVARYDHRLGDRLWRAMASDSMPAFVAEHPELVTAAHVR